MSTVLSAFGKKAGTLGATAASASSSLVRTLALFGGIGTVLAVGYFLFPADRSLITAVLVAVIVALSLDLLVGYAGILTLGHTLWFGIGAYGAALLALNGWTEAITGALLAGALAGALALAIGPFLLRFTGLPLIMMTVALNAIAFEAANQMTWLTGGDDGLTSIKVRPLLGVFRWTVNGSTQYLYAAVWMLLMLLLLRSLVRSPFGLSLKGIKANKVRMQLIGAPVIGQLTLSYGISAFMAGVAGAVGCQTTGFVGLGTLSPELSINLLVMLAIGGIGNLYGALFGVPVFMFVRHAAATWNPYHWLFFVGMLLIAARYAKGGLLGLLPTWRRR